MKKKCDICGMEYTQNNYLGQYRTAHCPTLGLMHQISSVKTNYSEAMRKQWLPRIKAHGGVIE